MSPPFASGVRIAVSELIILICGKIGLQPTLGSFRKLANARIVLGKKFTRSGEQAQTFWATDTTRSSVAGCRRDMLFLKGTVSGSALCGEAICFVHISNLQSACAIATDDMNFVLIR